MQANFGDRENSPSRRARRQSNPGRQPVRITAGRSARRRVCDRRRRHRRPLLPQQCQALARRVPLGLARTGTTGSHFSGDIFWRSRPGTPAPCRRLGVSAAGGASTPRPSAVGTHRRALRRHRPGRRRGTVNALVAAERMIGRNGFAHRSCRWTSSPNCSGCTTSPGTSRPGHCAMPESAPAPGRTAPHAPSAEPMTTGASLVQLAPRAAWRRRIVRELGDLRAERDPLTDTLMWRHLIDQCVRPGSERARTHRTIEWQGPTPSTTDAVALPR